MNTSKPAAREVLFPTTPEIEASRRRFTRVTSERARIRAQYDAQLARIDTMIVLLLNDPLASPAKLDKMLEAELRSPSVTR